VLYRLREHANGAWQTEKERVMRKLMIVSFLLVAGIMGAVSSAQAGEIQVGPGSDLAASRFDHAGEKLNIDKSSAAALTAGTYDVVDFEYLAGATVGDVQPFLAIEIATDTFSVIWIGGINTSSGVAGVQNVLFAAGTERFTLDDDATVFAGFNVSDNVIPFGGGTTAHAISANWDLEVGSVMAPSYFYRTSLGRSYAFEINVETAPSLDLVLFTK